MKEDHSAESTIKPTARKLRNYSKTLKLDKLKEVTEYSSKQKRKEYP
jgi:hypothetical protein